GWSVMSDNNPPQIDQTIVGRNLMRFGRRLRAPGVPVGSGDIIGFFQALDAAGVERKDDVYHTARSVMTTRPEQFATFDIEFERFWRDLVQNLPPLLDSSMNDDEE